MTDEEQVNLVYDWTLTIAQAAGMTPAQTKADVAAFWRWVVANGNNINNPAKPAWPEDEYEDTYETSKHGV